MEVRDISEQKVTESMLTESVRRYTDLYDNAPDMYVSVDAYTAIIRQCNATCARKLGYTKEEIVGRPIFDLYHSDCMPEVRASFQMFMTNGEVADTELQLMRKDGSTIDVSLSVTAVRNEAGEILYSRSAWRDITEKKRARELLKQEKEKLKEALREIRKLNGLLPICASCKKIRDDRGYWRQIESYIVEHSEAMFSHSICPDCRVQLYPRPTDTDEGSIES